MTLNQHKNKKKYVIIASLKTETMGKLINRTPGSSLLISCLPRLALRQTDRQTDRQTNLLFSYVIYMTYKEQHINIDGSIKHVKYHILAASLLPFGRIWNYVAQI